MKTAAARAEKEALEWAIDFFRGCATELKSDIREKTSKDEILWFEGWLRADPDFAVGSLAVDVDLARHGDKLATLTLFGLAAARIERGEPLPEPLRGFVAEFLRKRKLETKIKRTSGPDAVDRMSRNNKIVEATAHIVDIWRFPATRNPKKTKCASAASIVAEGLQRGAGIYLTEASVNKIWNEGDKFLLSWPNIEKLERLKSRMKS